MTAAEFLQQLAKNLSPLTPEERENALSYYREYLEEAGADEAAAIEALGSPQSVAQRIISELNGEAPASSPYMENSAKANSFSSAKSIPPYSAPKYNAPQYSVPPLNESKSGTDGARIAMTVTILIVTSPFWFSVLIIWASLIFSMAATWLAFVAAAFVGPIQGIMYFRDGLIGSGLWDLGGGVLCAGLALLLWYPFLKATTASSKGLFRLSKMIVSALLGKETSV